MSISMPHLIKLPQAIIDAAGHQLHPAIIPGYKVDAFQQMRGKLVLSNTNRLIEAGQVIRARVMLYCLARVTLASFVMSLFTVVVG